MRYFVYFKSKNIFKSVYITITLRQTEENQPFRWFFAPPKHAQKYVFFRVLHIAIAARFWYTSDGRNIPNRPNPIL